MVNGMLSLISTSDSSMLVYRNSADLCILILDPAILLNHWGFVEFFFGNIFRIFYMISCHMQTVTIFLFFPIWILFISFFFCLIAVAYTSNSMLNKIGKSGHPCLVLFFLFIVIPVACGSSQARGWSGLQMEAYHTATTTLDLSHICDLCCSLQQHWIFNPLSEVRDWTHILTDIMLGS